MGKLMKLSITVFLSFSPFLFFLLPQCRETVIIGGRWGMEGLQKAGDDDDGDGGGA